MRVTAPPLALAVLCAASCGPAPAPWYSQLEPDSPCYRVDLMDGLDEQSTAEVQDLFGCVNHNGHVQPLASTAQALEESTPAGEPAGITVAKMANAMPTADVQLLDLVTGSLALVKDEPLSIAMQNIFLEAIYGENHVFIRRDGYDLNRADAIEQGLITPLTPVIPKVAASLQADDGEAMNLAADILEDPETHRWIWTVEGWVRADHPDVSGPVDGLIPHLGDAIVASKSPANDRWRGASGHSIKDLTLTLTEGDRDLVAAIGPDLRRVLADQTVRAALPDLLVR
ncbi:MAG: hypothetical protein AB8H79_27020, partial [Myxococcota bacterium]